VLLGDFYFRFDYCLGCGCVESYDYFGFDCVELGVYLGLVGEYVCDVGCLVDLVFVLLGEVEVFDCVG